MNNIFKTDVPPVLEEELNFPPEKLKARAIFGINGKVSFGLHLHPNKKNIIFPLGNKIGIGDVKTDEQEFVAGHTHIVSCIAVSQTGKYLASGQSNHMGFRAFVMLWDFETRRNLAKHDLHKGLVQAICFTAEEKFVVSIGGEEDGSVIVFDIQTHVPICRSVAARAISGGALAVKGFNNSPNHFIVAGERHLRVWSIERERKKLTVHDVCCGKHQRLFTCIDVDAHDNFVYLGTMTGDIVKVAVNFEPTPGGTSYEAKTAMIGAFGTHNPRKPFGKDCCRYVNGIREILIMDGGTILIAAGDGTIEMIEERKEVTVLKFKEYPSPTWPLYRTLKKAQVNGAVTSVVPVGKTDFYVCTDMNEIYAINIKTFGMKLLKTCHRENVADIVFPRHLATVFATAGYETIRVWSTKRLQELLRIVVYNFECTGIVFTSDGTSIVSAWNDGILRAFTPISGRLIYAIPNAHNKGCSAIAISSNGRILVSGGVEGQVRVWKIEPLRQSLLAVLKDHSAPVSSLEFNHLDTEVISSSSDGSCVIWDVKRLARKQVITANTQFMKARYFPTSVQLLTCGTDGCISYWMVFNGGLIRELTAAQKSSINSIAINSTGDYFVSVGADQFVKLWEYNRGIVLAQASDHASSITCVAYSPDGKFFVTGSKDGTIIIWDVPEAYHGKINPPPAEPVKSRSKFDMVSAKVVTSDRSATGSKENIDELVSKTRKGNVCCVECPPVDTKKKPDINEQCNFNVDVKTC